MLKNIYSRLSESEQPIVQVMIKEELLKVLAIGLKKDVELADHVAPGHAKIVVIQGQIKYISKERALMLSSLDELDIPLEEVHKVVGIEDAIFLVIIRSII